MGHVLVKDLRLHALKCELYMSKNLQKQRLFLILGLSEAQPEVYRVSNYLQNESEANVISR